MANFRELDIDKLSSSMWSPHIGETFNTIGPDIAMDANSYILAWDGGNRVEPFFSENNQSAGGQTGSRFFYYLILFQHILLYTNWGCCQICSYRVNFAIIKHYLQKWNPRIVYNNWTIGE